MFSCESSSPRSDASSLFAFPSRAPCSRRNTKQCLSNFTEKATDGSLQSEDWTLNMEICDIINETEEGYVFLENSVWAGCHTQLARVQCGGFNSGRSVCFVLIITIIFNMFKLTLIN